MSATLLRLFHWSYSHYEGSRQQQKTHRITKYCIKMTTAKNMFSFRLFEFLYVQNWPSFLFFIVYFSYLVVFSEMFFRWFFFVKPLVRRTKLLRPRVTRCQVFQIKKTLDELIRVYTERIYQSGRVMWSILQKDQIFRLL